MREKLSKVSACKMRDHSTWIPSLNGQYLNLAFIISYSVQIIKKKKWNILIKMKADVYIYV